MPLIRPIQPNFGSGELSPAVYARVDIPRYFQGLRTCRNFTIHPFGGASNRPGTLFVNAIKNSTLNQSAIVQEFIFNEDQSYILEFGDEYVRFYTNGTRVSVSSNQIDEWVEATAYVTGDYVTVAGGTVYYADNDNTGFHPVTYPATWTATTIYEEPTPWGEDDLSELRFESSADVIYITHPDYQPRTLTRYGATDFRVELYDPQDGPFAPENLADISVASSATSGSVSLTSTSAVFAETDVGALFKVRHFVDGSKDSGSLTTTTSSTAISAFTTWRIITHGTWTAECDIEKSSDAGATWSVIRSFSSVDDFNIDTSGTEDIEVHPVPFLVRLTVTDFTSGSINYTISSDAYFQSGVMEITTFNSTTSVWADTITDLGDTVNSVFWSHGAWSATRGYPEISAFFQDRLCFAATVAEPQTIWMSQTGIYNSFFRNTTLLDTDGITINLPSRQVNKINGLVSLNRLLVFTNSSEWSIGSSSTGVITPTTIDTNVEGYRGSSGVPPVVVGNEVLYMQNNGKTVRNFGFELASESFTGEDINILAKHLFQKWTITDLAYQQEPDSIIWALRSDGCLLGCTYMRDQKIIAWHWHDTGDLYNDDGAHTVTSTAIIPNSVDNFDELWMVVQRTNGTYIEKLAKRLRTDPCTGEFENTQNHLDSAVKFGGYS